MAAPVWSIALTMTETVWLAMSSLRDVALSVAKNDATCLEVQPTAVEHLTPCLPPGLDVVSAELSGGEPEHLLRGGAVLLQESRVDLGDALGREDVIQQPFALPFTGAGPGDRFVQHHHEQPGDGLRKQQFEQFVIGRW